MPALELVFRMAAFTELSILTLMLFLHGVNNRVYHYAAILFLGIACYLLAPLVLHHWQWGVAAYPIILMAIVVPALFWFFACAVFADHFSPPTCSKWLLAATAFVGFFGFCTGMEPPRACQLDKSPYLSWLAQIAKLLWVTATFITVLKDWQTDLVEPRRRLRRLIILGGGCYMVAVIVVELFIQNWNRGNKCLVL